MAMKHYADECLRNNVLGICSSCATAAVVSCVVVASSSLPQAVMASPAAAASAMMRRVERFMSWFFLFGLSGLWVITTCG
jgi:hypothetical protein